MSGRIGGRRPTAGGEYGGEDGREDQSVEHGGSVTHRTAGVDGAAGQFRAEPITRRP